jgi:replicative DNA helicase
MTPDRNIEAEYNIIGAILQDNRIITRVASKLSPDDFTIEHCATIYEAAVDASERGKAFDVVVAADVLKRRVDERTAAAFVLDCVNATPTTVNAELHASIIHKHAGARRLKEAAYEVMQESDGPQDLATSLITTCQNFLHGEKTGRLKTLSEALVEFVDEKPDNTLRMDTGFPKLDGILKGLTGGNLIIIGARPGVGKSAFSLDIARTAAGKGNKILIYSMEMLAVELAERIVARDPRLTLDKIIDKQFTADDWKAVIDICGSLSRLPIMISEEPYITVSKIRSQAMATPDVKMIIVDFLTLMGTV